MGWRLAAGSCAWFQCQIRFTRLRFLRLAAGRLPASMACRLSRQAQVVARELNRYQRQSGAGIVAVLRGSAVGHHRVMPQLHGEGPLTHVDAWEGHDTACQAARDSGAARHVVHLE